MIIFPAIDIIGGQCVRLTEGDFARKTVYSSHPAEMALQWQEQGAKYLHLVDLDGALAGSNKNKVAIQEVLGSVDIPVQLGGGIRSLDNIEYWLEHGISRVILGSVAVKNPSVVAEAIRKFGSEKIVVGIDAKDSMVAVQGWEQVSSLRAMDLGNKMADMGVQRIIFTDIARDGMLQGINIAATMEMARQTGLRVIASGGVSCLEDIKKLCQVSTGLLEGVVVGKALYDKRLLLQEALCVANNLE